MQILRPVSQTDSWLDRPLLARLDWEKMAYLALIVIGLVTRLYDLGTRAMSHDESLHTYFSYNFATGKGYTHTPLMHGPFLFHITALSYFLFGDSDFTSRLPFALLGVATIASAWYFRRWLGRTGALLMALGLLISPSNLYYARYIRQEISVVFWLILTVFAIWRFVETRQWRFLVLLTVSLALHGADKSTNFFVVAQMTAFLAAVVMVQLAKSRDMIGKAMGFVVLTGALFLVSCILFEAISRLATSAFQPTVNISVEGGVNLNGGAYATIGVLLLLCVGYSFVACLALRRYFGEWLEQTDRKSSAFAPIVVLVTTTLFMASPAMLLLINPIWRMVTGEVLVDIGVLDEMSALNNNVKVVMTMLALSMALIACSAAIGVAWNWRRYLKVIGIFLAITVPQFTSLFTNPGGIASGFVGQLGYWMAQQGVKRGSQPDYYYLVIVPLYEYLPIFGTLLALGVIGWRLLKDRTAPVIDQGDQEPPADNDQLDLEPLTPRNTRGRITRKQVSAKREINLFFITIEQEYQKTIFVDEAGNEVAAPAAEVAAPRARRSAAVTMDGTLPNIGHLVFPLFLAWWMLSNWLTFSSAGEKMPWLTIHIAQPMIMLTAWVLALILRPLTSAWRNMDRNRQLWLVGLSILFVLLAVQVLSSIGGWPSDARKTAGAAAMLVLKTIALVATSYGLYRVTRVNAGERLAGRAIVIVFCALLAVLTFRTAYIATFINFDYAKEYLFYAHGGNTVKTGLNQLQQLSERLTGGSTMKIGYDSDSSWPMSWYMREFPNAGLISEALPDNFNDYDAFVIGDANKSLSAVQQKLAANYTQHKYMLVWWPYEEGYRNVTWTSFSTNMANAEYRAGMWDVIFSRDFTKYAKYFNIQSLTPETWSPGHNYFLYVRNDVAQRVWDYRAAAAVSGDARNPIPVLQVPRNSKFSSIAFVGEDRWVTDFRAHKLLRIDDTGALKVSVGSKGNGPAQFEEPWAMLADPKGGLYVADTFNHRVQKLDAEGRWQWSVGSFEITNAPGNARQTKMFGPRDLALDSKGRLLVADTGNKRVQVLDSEGNFVAAFGAAGEGPGQFSEPVGLEVDAGGNIYVADTWNKRVQVFDSEYRFVRQFPVAEWVAMGENELRAVDNKPYLASNGNVLFVGSPRQGRVLAYTMDGKKIENDSLKLPPGTLPLGMIAKGGRLFVTDGNSGSVRELELDSALK